MEIVRKGPFKVVGIRVVADWESLWTEMPRAWRDFAARHGEIRNRVADTFLDVCAGKSEGKYTQLICAEVSEIEEVPAGMVALEIPSLTCVRYEHHGPLPGIAASFGRMYEWAQRNDHVADEFKLDIGYTLEGTEEQHELFIRLLS